MAKVGNVRIMRWKSISLVLLLIFAEPVFATSSNAVVYWNDQALQLIRKNSVPPPKASRILGLVHISIMEAVNSVQPGYKPYDHYFDQLVGQPINAVVALSAAAVLKREFPEDVERINLLLGDNRNLGAEVGEYIVNKHPLVFGKMEQAESIAGYEWEPTSPKYAAYLLPEWCALAPLGIASAKEYRKKGPPPAGSKKLIRDLEETKSLGGKDSVSRTQDQAQIALFWADGAGTVTPPGHWNQIATQILERKKTSILESARIMALLNMALADAAIVAWDMKFKHNFARPINLFESEGWEPLIVTPPFPEYVSGHSTFSGAAAEVLTRELGHESFTTTSDGLPNVTRSYSSFDEAAVEAGRSRIYGGIHFAFSDEDGRKSGREIASYILSNYFQPISKNN